MSGRKQRQQGRATPGRILWRSLVVVVSLAMPACAFWEMSDWSERAAADGEGGNASRDAEAGADVDGSGFFCNGPSDAVDGSFCDDFDHKELVDFGWNRRVTSGGGSVELSSLLSTSPPRALRVVAPSQGAAHLRKVIATAVHHLHYEARIYIEGLDPAGAYLCHQELQLPSGLAGVRLAAYEDSTMLGQIISTNGAPERTLNARLARRLPLRQWTKVELDVDLVTGVVSVRFDGEVVLDRGPLDPALVPAPLWSSTGLTYVRSSSAPGAAWTVHMDDVALRWD